MTFSEQILATLIGTFFGFMGSLVLFWIKEKVTKNNQKNSLVNNLRYELDYNIALYRKYEADITKCIECIGADDRTTFLNIDYEYIARFFAIQFYQNGLIQDYLHHEDMKRWNDFMITLSSGSQKYAVEQLQAWKNKEIKKEDAFSSLSHERDQIRDALKMTIYIKDKVTP